MSERVWRRGKSPKVLLGMKIVTATMENSMEVPQMSKYGITI